MVFNGFMRIISFIVLSILEFKKLERLKTFYLVFYGLVSLYPKYRRVETATIYSKMNRWIYFRKNISFKTKCLVYN